MPRPGSARQRAGAALPLPAARRPGGARPETLARIRALAIPPAWESVWICTRDDGHLQATGRDARGRKQYRYHPRWREVRDETKYGRMLAFAKALPRIRRRVTPGPRAAGLPRDKVLAAVVRLLETTRIRVGNEEYARANDSFGLTTLRTRQVRVQRLDHELPLPRQERRAAPRRAQRPQARGDRAAHARPAGLRAVPVRRRAGRDARRRLGRRQRLPARASAGEEFTSKDFRTWAGTVLAAEALARVRATGGQAQSPGDRAASRGSLAIPRRCAGSATSTPR